jgi:hypothetical protein
MTWMRAVASILVLWSSTVWGATLTWTASGASDLAGYRVYQCKLLPCTRASGHATLLVTLGKGTSSFNVGTPTVTQYYFLTAYDATNNESLPSNLATFIPGGGGTITLAVAGAPNLPLNGTTTLVTVGLTGAVPTLVQVSRDGAPPFATWPSGTFFTLATDGRSLKGNWCIRSACWGGVPGPHLLQVKATYANGTTDTETVTVNVMDAGVTLAVAPNLPLHGTTTPVTVGLMGAIPTLVQLSRDGAPPFATWPSGTFFTLATDGRSLKGNWCITSACWDGVPGPHVLQVKATYANGTTDTETVTVNVTD